MDELSGIADDSQGAEQASAKVTGNGPATAAGGGGAAADGGTVVSVPVSLPTSNGSTYNVITPEQLLHFKPMICVDNNGFISGNVLGDLTGDGKTTHIVFHQQGAAAAATAAAAAANSADAPGASSASLQEVTVIPDDAALVNGASPATESSDGAIKRSPGTTASAAQGATAATSQSPQMADVLSMDVLPVRCKTTSAELYKNRLGSGGRGRCIKYRDEWYTPSEFEVECGRGSSKDWKRSIRYGGRSLQALIDDSILTPHATSCMCSSCCDDESIASGPVRLFTPYKRRRRHQTDYEAMRGGGGTTVTTGVAVASGTASVGSAGTKKRRANATEDESETDQQIVVTTKEEYPWSLAEHIDASSDYLDSHTGEARGGSPMEKLQSVYKQMSGLVAVFKRTLAEVQEAHAKQVETLTQERDAVLAARVAEIDESAGGGAGMEVNGMKKCANCNRDAMAECSLCRRTPYCSTFCQRKDWNSHQGECFRDPLEATQQIMVLVDEQQ